MSGDKKPPTPVQKPTREERKDDLRKEIKKDGPDKFREKYDLPK